MEGSLDSALMAKTRVGINGFGRIGRNFFRAHLERGGNFELVAINDLGDAKTMGHLLKYDSVLGQLDEDVEIGDATIKAGKTELKVFSERDPANLPWRDLDRCSTCDRARHAGPAGKGRRHLRPRSRPDRVDHRPRCEARPRGDEGAGERGVPDGL